MWIFLPTSTHWNSSGGCTRTHPKFGRNSAVGMLVLLMGVALLLGVLLALSGNYVCRCDCGGGRGGELPAVKRAKPVLLVGPAAASLPFWLSPTSR